MEISLQRFLSKSILALFLLTAAPLDANVKASDSSAPGPHSQNILKHLPHRGAQSGDPSDRSKKLSASDGQDIAFEHLPGEVLVKFKGQPTQNEVLSRHAQVGAEVLSEVKGLRVFRVRGKAGESTEALMKAYARRDDVEYVEPNGIVHSRATPSDTRYPEQWSLHNTGQTGGVAGADIRAPLAWDLQTDASQNIIAVIDSGVDFTHPDLAANIRTNPGEIAGNGIDDDGNGLIDDVHGWNFQKNSNDVADDFGHGTHVAGIIGAVGNNGAGVAGVDWRAKILPVKFIGANGVGTFEEAARAVLYASQMGARIANASWGCGGSVFCFSQTIEDALKTAGDRGMLFITAAGNARSDNDRLMDYPCNSTLPNVLCVAATDANDRLASFSNFGETTVDIGAPGADILSTVPTGTCSLCDPSGYQFLSGTSMAAPHVAGAAALALARFPLLKVDELKNILIGGADSILGFAQGRLNVNNPLRSRFVLTATPERRAVPAGQSITYNITVKSLNGFSGPVSLQFSYQISSFRANLTGTFSANSVTLAPNGSASVTLTVSTTAGDHARGTFLIVRGTDGAGESHAIHPTLTLQTDLAVTLSGGPSSGGPGNSIPLSDTVCNQGTGASPAFYVGYYLSNDSDISASDILIGKRKVNGLYPGECSAGAGDFWIPSGTPPGDYFLGTVADILNQTPDSNPTNNAQLVHAFRVEAGAFRPAAWAARYNDPLNSDDRAIQTLTDAAGNIYVTGQSCKEVNATRDCLASDFVTIKYNPSGAPLWTARYDSGAHNFPSAMTIDPSGAVYVAGRGSNGKDLDYLVVKYGPAGNQLWTARYDGGGDDSVQDIGADPSGNVYLTGSTFTGGLSHSTTVKYSSAGARLWVANGESDSASALLVDPSGNVYVAGAEGGHFKTVKYSTAGALLWTATGNGLDLPGGASALAFDPSGNIYVAGGWDFQDFGVVKYSPAGTKLWQTRYDSGDLDVFGAFNSNKATGMAVDASGNVHLAGFAWNGLDYDYLTVKFDAAGVLLWSARYDNGQDDYATSIAVDPAGNVYLTGFSCGNLNQTCELNFAAPSYDSATIAYNSQGRPLWIGRYDGFGSIDDSFGVAVDPSGNVYVTGDSFFGSATREDYVTIKYAAPSRPDLVTASVSGPSSAVQGDALLLSGAVSNRGAADAGAFSVGFYLSKDAVITASDTFIGSRSVNGLAAGSSDNGNGAASIPSDLPPGNYYIGAIADDTRQITESNEANNGVAGNIIAIQSATRFFDDFNRTTGLGAGWKIYAGGFTTDGANAVSTGAANFAGVTPNLGTQDYTVETVLSVPAGSLYSGVIARGNPAAFTADLYAAQVATNGAVNLYRRNGSVWTLLKGVPKTITAGVFYTLALKVSGSNPVLLDVSVDGATLIRYSDASSSRIISGTPGVENYDAGVRYNQFSVRSGGAALQLKSISVTPASAGVLAGGRLQFRATGTYSDNSARDLTASVTWRSTDPAVATVGNQAGSQGLATGVAAGTATISATDASSGVAGAATLTVSGSSACPLTDCFDRPAATGLGADWNESLPDLEIFNNELRNVNAGSKAAIYTRSPGPDQEVSVDCKTAASGSSCGVVARWSDANNFYYTRIDPGLGNIKLFKFAQGVATQIGATATRPASAGRYDRIRLVVKGSALSVFFADETAPAITATDTSLAAGNFVGIRSYAAAAFATFFDNFKAGPVGANQSPVAKIVASPTSGTAPLAVHFDGGSSFDPDGTILNYQWSFGDGTTGTGKAVDHTYATAQALKAVLTVTDNQGATGTDQASITINPAALFSDDFNRTGGLGSNWKIYAGGFTTDGANAVSNGAANFAGITPAVGTNDYTVEGVLSVPAGALYSGLVARGSPTSFTGDLYAAQIATNGTVNLYRKNAGAWTLLKSVSRTITAGIFYTLKLKVSGSNPVLLEVSVDGSTLFSYSDSSSSRLTSGIPGIENYNTGVKYDRFKVTIP